MPIPSLCSGQGWAHKPKRGVISDSSHKRRAARPRACPGPDRRVPASRGARRGPPGVESSYDQDCEAVWDGGIALLTRTVKSSKSHLRESHRWLFPIAKRAEMWCKLRVCCDKKLARTFPESKSEVLKDGLPSKQAAPKIVSGKLHKPNRTVSESPAEHLKAGHELIRLHRFRATRRVHIYRLALSPCCNTQKGRVTSIQNTGPRSRIKDHRNNYAVPLAIDEVDINDQQPDRPTTCWHPTETKDLLKDLVNHRPCSSWVPAHL